MVGYHSQFKKYLLNPSLFCLFLFVYVDDAVVDFNLRADVVNDLIQGRSTYSTALSCLVLSCLVLYGFALEYV